ncbi:GFA family protein [Dyella japonica]|uniref:CENP-V/GFA domain-containing protein n=1 Tax=Dyella japonica TaxID=231455 RepID=A0ABV2JVI7_9GAMM
MQLQGQCHCGNIAYTLDWEPDPTEIPARACDCSFCTKHGGVWTSHPDGELRVTIRNLEQVHRYAFGTGTADFHICRECGVVPLVTCTVDGRIYAVVNVNTFDNVDPGLLQHRPASFSEESVASKLARRQANWIANVSFVERAA